VPEQGVGVDLGLGQVDPAAGLLEVLESLEDLLLRLRAEALQPTDPMVLGGTAQLRQGADAELVVQHLGPFGAETGYAQKVP
jgi:hypothetical protein